MEYADKWHLSQMELDLLQATATHCITLLLSSQGLCYASTLSEGGRAVKNCEAALHHPASIVRPKDVRQVQQCVKWALKHGVILSIIGGSHSGHCLWSNVVAVDMSAFDKIHISTAENDVHGCNTLVVVESGCRTGDIIRETMAAGITVPLGARPSVGAGLWLQGGIGHLTRLHGLACDAIIGAVVVGLETGQIFCIGHVPTQHQPIDARCPINENGILWAMKGAGTNFGIAISVTFKTFEAPKFSTRKWIIPLRDQDDAKLKPQKFDNHITRKLPQNWSADIYLYWEVDQLRLGITTFESSTIGHVSTSRILISIRTLFGQEVSGDIANSVDLFEVDMYMSSMHGGHGGHGGAKTSFFKRCLFLKDVGRIADILLSAIDTRPTPFGYLHLLHGGGTVHDIAADATAFGCRDWEFACVVTGVWARYQDNSFLFRTVVEWVYKVAKEMLPLCSGVYSADLGPDPKDYALAAKAFGPNGPRLARLKHILDPHNVLAYACPIQKAAIGPKLIILVTGESCAGKNYCAETWASALSSSGHEGLAVRKASISDITNREYAVATGADLGRLFGVRAYKEQHRPALTRFFKDQAKQRSRLPEEHFLDLVHNWTDFDVLLISGMRDEAPVAAFSYLVPGSRLLEVRVQASKETRRIRRGCPSASNDKYQEDEDMSDGKANVAGTDCCPSFIFDNEMSGKNAITCFAEEHLLPFFDEDYQLLSDMVRLAPNFPCPGIDFRHVLNIIQQPGGLALSLIRQAGKQPPPTVSVLKSMSHVSSSTSKDLKEELIEIVQDLIPRDALVVVVDDMLATGNTLCAGLRLLQKANVSVQDIRIVVVAEFPIHRGRELLRQNGFGGVQIQSLLIFDGA
ncbi:uncharacterized protein N7484_010442 [Penicillium longicatenatum]|uniref:uncharacterized protein n=1 Tax=Penicillium longicatenatum TaxID=1561947 RepID=UPI0025467EA6|nr:uncharacterized protein N7484_010442 [Penicillium longicatenatum]KAJ5630342.1 hypothetical protein N7484_010442 [Penicillium longicatenatum]